ncbi:hypothetical protein J6TS2_47240 [Heyndrickxia sporothermodurans]|nr:hypothetical protein J6TS2_47240 [Heyndrickxia sporothermodurans]
MKNHAEKTVFVDKTRFKSIFFNSSDRLFSIKTLDFFFESNKMIEYHLLKNTLIVKTIISHL